MRMKKLLTFLTLLTLSIGVTWAAEITDTWTATQGALGGSGSGQYGTITTASGKTWNYERNKTVYTAWQNGCIQLGSGSGAENITFYTSVYGTATIKSVSVECSSYNAAHKVSISVGGTTYLAPTPTDKWTTVGTKTGTGNSSGEIEIKFTDGTKAMYIKSISVTYDNGGSTPTTYSLTLPTGLTGGTVSTNYSGDLSAIPSGTEVTVTATPESGYDLSWMKANGTDVSSPYTFSITENTTITAEFTELQTPSGDTHTATYIFNTDNGLATLGITKPASGAGTDLEQNTSYNVDDVSLTTTYTGTSTRVWNASGTTELRIYNNGSITLSVPSGCYITGVEMAGNSVNGLSANVGTYSNGTWTGTAQSVTFNASATVKIHTITVTYTAPASSTSADYYLVGSFNMDGDNWVQQDVNYKFNKTGDNSYSLNAGNLPDDVEFKIIKVDGGNTTWYGGSVSDGQPYALKSDWHTNIPLKDNPNDGQTIQNFKMSVGGISNFTLNTSDMTFSVEKATPQFYFKSSADWTIKNAMTATADGWTITVDCAAGTNFGFNDEWTWYGRDNYWITNSTLGEEIDLYNNGTFYIENAGTYTFTVNSNKTKLVATKLAEGDLYSLIASTDDLEANHEYIVVGKTATATYVMSKTLNATGRAERISVTPDANGRISATDAMAIITLDGNSTDGWTLSTSEGYVASNGNGKMQFSSSAVTASIGFGAGDDTEAALIDFSNNTSYPRLKHNTSSQWFACYATNSGTANVYLYKKLTASNNSATPVITPASGNIVGFSQEVEITQANGGTIYYTTDGTTPTEDPTHQYNGKFWAEGENLGDEVTITAVAKEEGKELSNPVSVTYKFIAPAAPTFSPQGGTYTSYQYVELASATEGADVYYTTDGSNPSVNNGTKYTEPIAVTENVTIKAITVYHDAHVNKDATSGSRQAKYTIVTDGIVEVENIAEFNAIQPDENNEYPEVRFKNPVTVLYDYSQRSYSSQLQVTTYQEYIWVKDESGFTQIFLRPSLNSNNDEDHQIAFYENGDVIPGGFVVRKQYYETGEYYQAYSDKAGDDPTQPGNNVAAGFAGATQKALADPEPMTAAQLATLTTSDENIANYNNRYIRISKIKVTSIDGKNFDFEDENGNGSNIAGYNKYSDATSYMKDGETFVTETINFPQDASNNTYYDVTAILCTWRNGWEIMPIKFEPYVEKTVTLRDLCKDGVTTEGENEYTISNNLMGVYASKDGTKLWVKDDDGQAIVKYAPNDEYPDNFAINAEGNTRLDQQYYDQSNWCEIQLAEGEDNANDFVGKIIKGGSIQGKFTNKTNPTMTGVTLTNDNIYSDGSYEPNYYIPCNFYGNQSCQTSQHGQPGHGDYFFMTPKPQEYAMVVWAIWDSANEQFVVNENPQYNSHGFQGSFKVDLSLNQNPNIALHDGMNDNFAYNFSAIIRVNSSKAGSDFMVYPLDLSAATDPATAIESVVAGNGEVKSVMFYNVAGIESATPFQGVNIVVTEYTDGSRTTSKMLRK